MSAFEREEDDIQRRYAAGEITNAQMWLEMRELQRDYRDAARESAENAYRCELDNW